MIGVIQFPKLDKGVLKVEDARSHWSENQVNNELTKGQLWVGHIRQEHRALRPRCGQRIEGRWYICPRDHIGLNWQNIPPSMDSQYLGTESRVLVGSGYLCPKISWFNQLFHISIFWSVI